jgi:hypothetical protein
MKNATIAIPYAGITQVRFKGYLLSLMSAPLALNGFHLLQIPLEIKHNVGGGWLEIRFEKNG